MPPAIRLRQQPPTPSGGSRAKRAAILAALKAGPLRLSDLARRIGMSVGGMQYLLYQLEPEGLIHSRRDPNGRWYHLGADPEARADADPDGAGRDYDIRRTELAPGHTRVTFGARHRDGHGQRPGGHAGGGASSLWGLYA